MRFYPCPTKSFDFGEYACAEDSEYSHHVLGVSQTITLASFVDPLNFGFNNS